MKRTGRGKGKILKSIYLVNNEQTQEEVFFNRKGDYHRKRKEKEIECKTQIQVLADSWTFCY